MKLSPQQIRSITQGAARIVEDEKENVHFFRFSEEQEVSVIAHNDCYRRRSRGTSNIRMSFETDSRTLSLCIEVDRIFTPCTYFGCSIFCNGEKVGMIGSTEKIEGIHTGSYELPEGNKRITIYFPWSAITVLHALTLDDGASLLPIRPSRRILVYGDSITQGFDASLPELPFSVRLADAFDADIRNKGLAGECFYPPLATISENFDPEYILVSYGTNDWNGYCLETFQLNSRAFYENLRKLYPDVPIFALSPVFRCDWDNIAKRPWDFSLVFEQLRALADEIPGVTYIHGLDMFPNDPAYLQPDGVHPNDLGFAAFGDNLIAALKKYIKA